MPRGLSPRATARAARHAANEAKYARLRLLKFPDLVWTVGRGYVAGRFRVETQPVAGVFAEDVWPIFYHVHIDSRVRLDDTVHGVVLSHVREFATERGAKRAAALLRTEFASWHGPDGDA